LVNNAGSLIERQKLLEITEERWDEVMNLNLKSAMLCSQAVAVSMIERKIGTISMSFQSPGELEVDQAPVLTQLRKAG